MKIFFDWLTSVIQSAAPSLYAFIETTLPYTTPLPIATMSAASAGTFFGLTGFPAFALVYSLEGIGLVATTKLVDTLIEAIRSRNTRSWMMVIVLVITVGVYVRVLVSMNVKIHDDYNEDKAQVLTLVSYLPLLAGVLNGLGLMKLDYKKTTEAQLTLEEQRRREALSIEEQRRLQQLDFEKERIERELAYQREIELARIEADKQKTTAVANAKANAVQAQSQARIREAELAAEQQRLAAEQITNQQEEKYPGEVASAYKQAVFDILEQNKGNVVLTDITRLINQEHGTHFVHAKVKGTWYKYVQAWQERHRK